MIWQIWLGPWTSQWVGLCWAAGGSADCGPVWPVCMQSWCHGSNCGDCCRIRLLLAVAIKFTNYAETSAWHWGCTLHCLAPAVLSFRQAHGGLECILTKLL